MRFKPLPPPPPLGVRQGWRELYEQGAFAQRELAGESQFRRAAKERELGLGIGTDTLEYLDEQGALRPVAFAREGYFSGLTVPAEDPKRMRFSDEGPFGAWRNYEWRPVQDRDYAEVSPLYSGWQLLYAGDVVNGSLAELGVGRVLKAPEQREEQLEQMRGFFAGQNAVWRALDEAWSPTLRTLVFLQNRYWPQVTGISRVVSEPDGGWARAGPSPDLHQPAELLEQLGPSEEELLALYHFLVERALDRDPNDGLTMLRRARPRAFHTRWRGAARRAQDGFDAAELIRRFLFELSGEQPPPTPHWPLDGREREREELYARGPAPPWTNAELQAELQAVELYPHGVHVVGEGDTGEQVVVEAIVGALWPQALEEIRFSSLGGAGAAAQVQTLSEALSGYATRCVVIVDREGRMAQHVERAIGQGELQRDDVLLFDGSLEASNLSPQELLDVAQSRWVTTAKANAPVELKISVDALEAFHRDRAQKAGPNNTPGKAESLIQLVQRESRGQLRLDKNAVVDGLAELLAEEIAHSDGPGLEEVRRSRPIVEFVLARILEALNRPRPMASAQP